MNIKFAKGIEIRMDDGMYYLFDLNSKTIRKYDDYSKLPDILKNVV